MNKEEILQMSREENNKQDLYEQQVINSASSIATMAATVLAGFFFVMQVVMDKGANLAVLAVACSIPAFIFTMKAVKLKKKHEILFAILYGVATIALTIAHVYNLIA